MYLSTSPEGPPNARLILPMTLSGQEEELVSSNDLLRIPMFSGGQEDEPTITSEA